jgi:hypothetical protein
MGGFADKFGSSMALVKSDVGGNIAVLACPVLGE